MSKVITCWDDLTESDKQELHVIIREEFSHTLNLPNVIGKFGVRTSNKKQASRGFLVKFPDTLDGIKDNTQKASNILAMYLYKKVLKGVTQNARKITIVAYKTPNIALNKEGTGINVNMDISVEIVR